MVRQVPKSTIWTIAINKQPPKLIVDTISLMAQELSGVHVILLPEGPNRRCHQQLHPSCLRVVAAIYNFVFDFSVVRHWCMTVNVIFVVRKASATMYCLLMCGNKNECYCVILVFKIDCSRRGGDRELFPKSTCFYRRLESKTSEDKIT